MHRLIEFLRNRDRYEWVAVYVILCMVIGIYGSVQQMDEEARLIEIAQK